MGQTAPWCLLTRGINPKDCLFRLKSAFASGRADVALTASDRCDLFQVLMMVDDCRMVM